MRADGHGGGGQRPRQSSFAGDERFFLIASAVMVALIIAGFLTLYLRGISTFAAPWPVHAHVAAFMAWVGFIMLQVTLAAT